MENERKKSTGEVSAKYSRLSPRSSPKWIVGTTKVSKALILMLLFFLLGVAFALGHHFFYKSFDDTPVSSNHQQTWTIRIGTGLANLTNALFNAAIGVAFTQALWFVASRKAISLCGLDAMFSMLSNPLSLLSGEVYVLGWALIIISIVSWSMPLMSSVTPASLSVYTKSVLIPTNGLVPMPNFATSDKFPNVWADEMGAGNVGSPNPGLFRLLAATAASMAVLPVGAPSPNSSYTTQFFGPALKCDPLSKAITSLNLTGSCGTQNCTLNQLWNNTMNVPVSFSSYFSAVPQLEGISGERAGPNIFFVGINNNYSWNAFSWTEKIVCQLRNASYTVDWNFTDGIQNTNIRQLDLETTIPYTTYLEPYTYTSGENAYTAMFQTMTTLLGGYYGFQQGLSPDGTSGANFSVSLTGILACPEVIQAYIPAGGGVSLNQTTSPWMCRNGSVSAAIEDLASNYTLSLMSYGAFFERQPISTMVILAQNYWIYQSTDLLIAYITGGLATLLCVLAGSLAYYRNRSEVEASFSMIFLATRNTQLDQLVKENISTLGQLDKKALGKCELRYGAAGALSKDSIVFDID